MLHPNPRSILGSFLLAVSVLVLSAGLVSCLPTAVPKSPVTAPSARAVEIEEPVAERLILVSWDGAGDVLIDRLLDEGRLPHLAEWSERGARAEHMVSTVPSKTAPGHASIYTGCGPGVHGIGSNSTVHASEPTEHTALERYRGFSSTALRAEPLFAATVRQGLDTLILGASHFEPFEDLSSWLPADLPFERLRSFSPFEDRLLPSEAFDASAFGATFEVGSGDGVERDPDDQGWSDLPPHRGPVREIEIRQWRGIEPLDTPIHALAYEADEPGSSGLDRVLIRIGSKGEDASAEAILRPHAALDDAAGPEARQKLWSPPLEVRKGKQRARALFRLFHLAPDGSELVLYQRTASHFRGRHSDSDREWLQDSWPGGYDNPFRPYSRGRLGQPLPTGGDGTAEERLLEIAALDADLLIRSSQLAWQRWQPEAFLHYWPMTDHAGHSWTPAFDPTSPYYDPQRGERMWDFFARLVGHADRWLGELDALGGESTLLALVSDHGMTWVDRELYPNRILEQAGLLTRGDDGRIDPTRSRAFVSELEFAVRINDHRWKHGTVRPEDRDTVLRQATDALLGARDPETGRPLIHRVFGREELAHQYTHAESEPAEGPSLSTPDLFFDPAPGYYPRFGFPNAVARPVRSPWGNGTHGYWPESRAMHAIFYLVGPGVAPGVLFPGSRQIDVAPTLAHLLHIDPPADACGRVAFEALGPARAPETTPSR